MCGLAKMTGNWSANTQPQDRTIQLLDLQSEQFARPLTGSVSFVIEVYIVQHCQQSPTDISIDIVVHQLVLF